VINLCRLAGHLQMAGRFLEEHIAIDEISIQLLAVKAETTRISRRHMPDLDARPCTNASPSIATTQSKSSSRMQSSGFIKKFCPKNKKPLKIVCKATSESSQISNFGFWGERGITTQLYRLHEQPQTFATRTKCIITYRLRQISPFQPASFQLSNSF
jgi:hypothetical protein